MWTTDALDIEHWLVALIFFLVYVCARGLAARDAGRWLGHDAQWPHSSVICTLWAGRVWVPHLHGTPPPISQHHTAPSPSTPPPHLPAPHCPISQHHTAPSPSTTSPHLPALHCPISSITLPHLQHYANLTTPSPWHPPAVSPASHCPISQHPTAPSPASHRPISQHYATPSPWHPTSVYRTQVKEADLKLGRVVALDAGTVRERDWCNVITAHEGESAAYVWRLQHFTLGEHELRPPAPVASPSSG